MYTHSRSFSKTPGVYQGFSDPWLLSYFTTLVLINLRLLETVTIQIIRFSFLYPIAYHICSLIFGQIPSIIHVPHAAEERSNYPWSSLSAPFIHNCFQNLEHILKIALDISLSHFLRIFSSASSVYIDQSRQTISSSILSFLQPPLE